jgi:two-component system copper resistance phosphate regulon response regulator CusR
MRILIVEDEAKAVQYLKKGLEEQGYAVDLALDGDEGLRLALGFEYDLVILDVMLPKKDGWSVLRELRAAGKKNLVMFLTARDEVEDRVKGLNFGADAYLAKPFAFSELIAQIQTLFRRGPPRAVESAIEIEDLAIDPIRRIASRGGRRLDLTPREFSLLLLLARRRGEILSRTTISEQVWNIHFDAGSNSIDVHIRRLRLKVDEGSRQKLIQTVRGVGYVLEGGRA